MACGVVHLLSDTVSLLFETELFFCGGKLVILGDIAYGYYLCNGVSAFVADAGLVQTVVVAVEIDFSRFEVW